MNDFDTNYVDCSTEESLRAAADKLTPGELACVPHYKEFFANKLIEILRPYADAQELHSALSEGKISPEDYIKRVEKAENLHPTLSEFANCFFPKEPPVGFEPKASYTAVDLLVSNIGGIEKYIVLENGDIITYNRVRNENYLSHLTPSAGKYDPKLLSFKEGPRLNVLHPVFGNRFVSFNSEGLLKEYRLNASGSFTIIKMAERQDTFLDAETDTLQVLPDGSYLLSRPAEEDFGQIVFNGRDLYDIKSIDGNKASPYRHFVQMLPNGNLVGVEPVRGDSRMFIQLYTMQKDGSYSKCSQRADDVIYFNKIFDFQVLPDQSVVVVEEFMRRRILTKWGVDPITQKMVCTCLTDADSDVSFSEVIVLNDGSMITNSDHNLTGDDVVPLGLLHWTKRADGLYAYNVIAETTSTLQQLKILPNGVISALDEDTHKLVFFVSDSK